MPSHAAPISAAHGVRPRQPAPPLEVELLSGGVFVLADQTPERFTMVVFFRGLHCPICRGQLREIDRGLDKLAEKGVDVIAVSGDTRDRTQQLREEWSLERLQLGHGLTEPDMRAWGLFVSHGISEDEPALFNEPGLFLIGSDGTVFYESILSMPVGRPRLDELLAAIEYWSTHDYPARGEA